MNAAWALVPFILIRFGLLGLLDKNALKRAAFFPLLLGKEKIAYLLYQAANVLLFLYLFFLKISMENPWFYSGFIVYGLGIIVCIASMFNFAKPKENGIMLKGLYRVSRNPMYVGYFIYFLGCVLLTRSLILFAFLMVFQISAHWIILSEERWCINEFGEEYKNYMSKVRRYL